MKLYRKKHAEDNIYISGKIDGEEKQSALKSINLALRDGSPTSASNLPGIGRVDKLP